MTTLHSSGSSSEDGAVPRFLIYGLIDPRTRLIRYVGQSSVGMQRPKQHRRPSNHCYCGHWIRALQRQGLIYEIAVLEVLQNESGLNQAEKWWIAYGRACGWPLTNLTEGGALSPEARRKIEARAAARLGASAIRYTAEQLAEFAATRKAREVSHALAVRTADEISVGCFQLFAQGEDLRSVVIKLKVVPETVTALYRRWLREHERR